jgi:hypothetical protein
MPSTTSPPTTPSGRHQVPSTEPPATAAELGLTPTPAPAPEQTDPPPPAEVSPPPRAPLFRTSRRRQNPDLEGPDWPPVSEAGASTEQPSTTPPGTSSRASTDDVDDAGDAPRRPEADPRPLRDVPELTEGIATAIHAVGDELNERLAPGTELFLTDRNDEQGLARPTSRLIVRRMPADLGAAANPDLADLIAAAIVLVRYGVKQLNLTRALRRQLRAAADDGMVPVGTPPAEPAAA